MLLISQHYPNVTVTLSDDELFDTKALQKALQNPELNNLPVFFTRAISKYYGEACPMTI